MMRPLACGCDPADTARCPRLRNLRGRRDALAKEAEGETDAGRRALLWQAHHRTVVEIGEHLSRPSTSAAGQGCGASP